MKRSASGVAHYHFARLWAARHDDSSHVFANGHIFGKAERRSSLRMLIRMMRRERDIEGYRP